MYRLYLNFIQNFPGMLDNKFGYLIKGIHFKEVPEGGPPLYARMVALNTSTLPLICDIYTSEQNVLSTGSMFGRRSTRGSNKHHLSECHPPQQDPNNK